jgi:hypothetical protein
MRAPPVTHIISPCARDSTGQVSFGAQKAAIWCETFTDGRPEADPPTYRANEGQAGEFNGG